MKRPRGTAALILLVAVFMALPCRALDQPVTRFHAGDRSVAIVLQHSPSTSSHGSPREHLIQRLAVPDTAVIVLAAGVLLIFLESNLPGAIIPGAFGLFLVLSGIYGLALHPLRPTALLLLLAAGALLAFSTKGSLPLINALAGTTGLIYGLSILIPLASAPLRVHLPVAAAIGLAIGPSAFLLIRIADRAHRNKIILLSPPQTDPQTLGTERAEREQPAVQSRLERSKL